MSVENTSNIFSADLIAPHLRAVRPKKAVLVATNTFTASCGRPTTFALPSMHLDTGQPEVQRRGGQGAEAQQLWDHPAQPQQGDPRGTYWVCAFSMDRVRIRCRAEAGRACSATLLKSRIYLRSLDVSLCCVQSRFRHLLPCLHISTSAYPNTPPPTD